MRGAYGIGLVSILALLILPIISAVPVLAPCVPLSIPLTHLASYTVRVAPPYNAYLFVTDHILHGQLPCTVTGMHDIPLVLNGKIKQKISIVIAADYSFSILQKEALIGCAEEVLTKQFLLRNKGNVVNIYTLSGAKPQKIVLGPDKETLFTVSHQPEDPLTQIITIETTYGKKHQRYALSWEIKPCLALSLSVPEEVKICRGRENKLVYSIENNGTTKEEITVANETFSLVPGEKTNKSIAITGDTETFSLSLQVRNKTIKAPVQIKKISQCHKLTAPLSVQINEEEGTFSLPITNSGIEEATYAFEAEHPNIQLQTKSLLLRPSEKSDLIFSYNNISRSEVILIAQTANETQKIRVYITTGKSFIEWSRIDWTLLSLGDISVPNMGLVIIVLVILIGCILFWRGQGEAYTEDEIDLEKAKPSWFATYDRIDFNHLFDEKEEVVPMQVQPRRNYFRTVINFFVSLVILVALVILPVKDPFLALGLGGVSIILGVFWLLIKNMGSIPWKKIAAGLILVITLALFFFLLQREDEWNTYVPALNITYTFSEHIIPSTLYFSPVLWIFGACFAGFLLLALLRKGWKTWKQWRERRKEEQEIAALATKIAHVERKTRSLKNSLLRRSMMTRLLDFFYPETEELKNDQASPSPAQITPSPHQTANDKQQTSDFLLQTTDYGLSTTDHQPLSTDHLPHRLWRYVTDFFFEDIPEDFVPVERKEDILPTPKKRRIKRKRKKNTRSSQ